MNSRSASWAPAARASSRPEPNDPGGLVVRDPQRGGAAGGEDRGAGGELPAVGGHDAAAGQDAGGAVAFEDLDVGVRDGRGRQRAQDPPSRRAPAGVDDPAAAVAALEPERQVAAAVGVELDAELLQLADPVRRLVGQHLGGGSARQAAPGDQRVLQVQLRRVVDRERRGGAALRPVGGRLGERPRGHERHFGALPGGGEGGEQPGRAGAHDDEVGSHAATPGITVCAMEESSRRVLWLRDEDVMAHDVPGHPERPARIRALEAEMSAHGWFGALRVAGAVGGALGAGARAPGALRRVHRGAVRGRRRRDRRRHVRGPRHVRGGAAVVRRCGVAGRRAARRRGRGRRERGATARPPRRGRAGDGVLLLRQRRRGGAARDVRARALARA